MRRARRLMRCIAAALCAASLAPAFAKPPQKATEAELRELRGRIEHLQEDLEKAEKTKGGATEQLRESEKAVSEAQRSLFALGERRQVLEAQLESVGKRERDVRAGVSEHEALAGRLLRLQYRQGNVDRLRLLLEGRDAATTARHLAYYGYIQKARAEAIGTLRGTADQLAALDREARARRDELTENQAEQEREAKRLEKERAARVATVQRLSADIAKGQREIGRLKRDEAQLARLVEEISKAIATKPAPPAPSSGRKVERVADASLSAKPFESLKGRMRLPVRGELMNQYGGPRDEGGTWKGLFIRSVSGETIHAIADGRVVYADWLRGFGNLLILDHGGGYMSLYANNESLLRNIGDPVRSGDPIAHVGASGGHAESGLYFELRRDGKPFDPIRWVAF